MLSVAAVRGLLHSSQQHRAALRLVCAVLLEAWRLLEHSAHCMQMLPGNSCPPQVVWLVAKDSSAEHTSRRRCDLDLQRREPWLRTMLAEHNVEMGSRSSTSVKELVVTGLAQVSEGICALGSRSLLLDFSCKDLALCTFYLNSRLNFLKVICSAVLQHQ